MIVPKGFFPQQDVGRIVGSIQAEQDISFPAMSAKMAEFAKTVLGRSRRHQRRRLHGRLRQSPRTPGACSSRSSRIGERKASADQVIDRLRGKLAPRAGRRAVPAGRAGRAHRRPHEQRPVPVHAAEHRPGRAQSPSRRACSPSCASCAALRDVATDQQNRGLQASLVIDRDTASRLGILPQAIDDDALRRLRPAPGLDHLHRR